LTADRDADLPRGTVTLLFTDIEGSTQHVARLRESYAEALAVHRRLVRESFARHRGVEVDTQGDAFFAVFERAGNAVAAAADIQRALDSHDWPGGAPLQARIGVHTGEPTLVRGGYYVGIDLTRGARICAAAHGGQVVLSQATRELLETDVEVIELGGHVLKGIDRPERLFQLRAPGLREAFPPLRAPTPGNLPRPRTALIGRRRESKALIKILHGDTRLVTLTGLGGAGKTRLAVEVAHDASRAFPDGAYFVPLASVTDDTLVPALVAEALDISEEGSTSLLDALARALAERKVLLVLDNFEQLLAAGSFVGELLDLCPSVKVLATSRERLHLSGEHEYAMPPLTELDAEALFRTRVLAASPDAVLDQSARATVAAICSRLEGSPLALELAAARARILPLQSILDRLEQRLSFLTDGARDLPARQQTLEAAIDWSFELLSPDERVSLARLAVFAGGWSLEAAEAVLRTSDALPQLASLRDKSLIVARTSSDGGPRFAMLETIVEYALQRLRDQGVESEARQAHAEYFLELVEQAELTGPRESEWFARLVEEQRNIGGALAWARAEGRSDLLLQSTGALWRFWFVRGHLTEGRGWLTAALERRPAEPSLTLQRALLGASALALAAGDRDAARAFADERLEVCHVLGDAELLASALSGLANVKVWLGEREEAAELYDRAADEARAAGLEEVLAVVTVNRGYLALIEGDAIGGESHCAEAATVFKALGRRVEAANARLNVAVALVAQERADEADPEIETSLRTYLELENLDGISCALDVAAAAAAGRDPQRASILFGAAGAARQATGATAPPVEQALRERTKQALEQSLGATAFAAHSNEGALLDPRAAANIVLGDPNAER
jgi:predicted ATPase/class 3 adenylate cyclase